MKLSFIFIILSSILSSVNGVSSLYSENNQNDQEKRCMEITVPMCRNIGYNLTSMPNQFHHESQEEAGLDGKFHLFYLFFCCCGFFERIHKQYCQCQLINVFALINS